MKEVFRDSLSPGRGGQGASVPFDALEAGCVGAGDAKLTQSCYSSISHFPTLG